MADRSKGISRREFLAGMGATVAVGAAAGRARAQEDDPPGVGTPDRVLGPGAVDVEFTLNGKATKIEVEPRVTLLDALRHRIGLTGAKEICDRGSCGGCTVLLDEEPINACMVLAIDASGRNVQTVEGLATDGALTAVQSAFVEHDALQCGFCTPGMVLSVHALLARNSDPTPEEIGRATSGNLCRCGSYVGILRAALAAAQGGGK